MTGTTSKISIEVAPNPFENLPATHAVEVMDLSKAMDDCIDRIKETNDKGWERIRQAETAHEYRNAAKEYWREMKEASQKCLDDIERVGEPINE